MNNKQTSEVSLGTTLYDINKQMILKTEKELSEDGLEKIKKELEIWFNWYSDSYAMLLCRERYDFTVFHLYQKEHPNPPAVATHELISLLKERGKILSLEREIDDNRWEIWIQIDDEAYAYYLFGCDDWVIEC